MDFERPLIAGRLIQRYKRFLADVELADFDSAGVELACGDVVTAHCANPGAMLGLAEPGMRIWLEPNDNPKRKLRYAWRLVELPGGAMAGIDTSVPNRIVGEALRAGSIGELAGYRQIRPEQRYGANSRIDFLLTGDAPDCYVEVKNVHLMRAPGLAEFPDCVTARGTKHLRELAAMAEAGHRAVMFYVVQRDDCGEMALADDLDPAYFSAFRDAHARGVEVLVYRAKLSTTRISLERALPFVGETRG